MRQVKGTCTTNCLRHGTQFGVPMREELVTVSVGVRWDAGSACRPWREFQNVHATVRIGTHPYLSALSVRYYKNSAT